MYQLILASQSPRRKEILHQAGFIFQSDSVKVSEIIDENLNLEEALQLLARQKAEAFLQSRNFLKNQKILVLTADTVVVLAGRALGKPQDNRQAEQFLSLLSGQTHSVKSAICLWEYQTNRVITALDSTSVQFRPLASDEIKNYVRSGEPMDKAGAYAIQGEGGRFVESYSGSWTNVVGLPLELLEKLLKDNGWIIDRRKSESCSR